MSNSPYDRASSFGSWGPALEMKWTCLGCQFQFNKCCPTGQTDPPPNQESEYCNHPDVNTPPLSYHNLLKQPPDWCPLFVYRMERLIAGLREKIKEHKKSIELHQFKKALHPQ